LSVEEKTMYQQIILQHNKNPHNFGALENPQFYSKGVNRLCGDQYTVSLLIDDSKRIELVMFEGEGCALSKASASIMTEMVQGKSFSDVKELSESFDHYVTDLVISSILDENTVTEWRAFSEMKNFPARKKCVTIIWQTLIAAISDQKNLVVE